MFVPLGKDPFKRNPANGVRNLTIKVITAAVSLVVGISLVAGCASRRFAAVPLPPVMSHDEISRPFVKVGVVECSRERIGPPEILTPEDHEWAYAELRNSARKLDADAVVSVEVRLEQDSFLMVPVNSVRARGVAIRFR